MIFLLEDFLEDCKNNLFTDYDGFGEFLNRKNEETRIYFCPSNIVEKMKEYPDYIYIKWYNR